MAKDPIIESLLGTTFYFEHLKKDDNDRTKELFRRAFLGSNELIGSIAKELTKHKVRFEISVTPYTAASVIGIRWTFEVIDNNITIAKLFSDGALNELFFEDPFSTPRQIDSDAFSDDKSIISKASKIGVSWSRKLQACLSSKSSSLISEPELSRAKCIQMREDQIDSDTLLTELNTFVVDLPLPFREGGILSLQYEAQMMDFLHKHRLKLGLNSSIPKPIIPGNKGEESSAEIEQQERQQKSDQSILEIIEKNHPVGFRDILRLYFGISPNSQIRTPSDLFQFQQVLFSMNMFFVPMIYRPGCDMVTLWRRFNLVHTALTSLSHQINQNSFQIEWHKNIHLGVANHSTFIRNLNKGLKYPNLRMSGLADFEHVCRAPRNYYGVGIFAKSITELIILCVSSCLINKCSILDTATILRVGLSEILAKSGRGIHKFNETWENEELDNLIGDVKEGQKRDQLALRRIVRASELFVLTLEGFV